MGVSVCVCVCVLTGAEAGVVVKEQTWINSR